MEDVVLEIEEQLAELEKESGAAFQAVLENHKSILMINHQIRDLLDELQTIHKNEVEFIKQKHSNHSNN